MRTETYTVTKTYYTYDELSEQAKERARQDYVNNDFRNEDFYEMVLEELGEVFGDIKCQYSLRCCQGDGFNTYGTATFGEIFAAAEWYQVNSREQFTGKEKRALNFYWNRLQEVIVPLNRQYTYSTAEYIEFAEDLIENLKYWEYRDINEDLIYRFERFTREVFAYIDAYYEKWGYEYLYNIPDEEYAELSDINGWEYDEEGRIA